jgi:hypothetical protein
MRSRRISGSFRPKRAWARTKWPEEETGKNSQRPWIRAKERMMTKGDKRILWAALGRE